MKKLNILRQLGVLALSVSLITANAGISVMADDLTDPADYSAVEASDEEIAASAAESETDLTEKSETELTEESATDLAVETDPEMLAPATGKCGGNLTWAYYADHSLVITGSGDMYDYGSDDPAPWQEMAGSITSIELPENLTSIGRYAFYSCCNVTSITIPSEVSSIGAYAFNGWTSITSIEIPEDVQCIEDFAFEGCRNLKDIYIYSKNIIIEFYAICPKLEEVSIITIHGYDNVQEYVDSKNAASDIPNLVFDDLRFSGKCGDNLTWKFVDETIVISGTGDMYDYTADFPAPWYDFSGEISCVTLPDGATSIGDCAFDNCSNLAGIVIPDSVTSIGSFAFRDCHAITEISIPDGVTYLGLGAFYSCRNLMNLTIPEGVTSIGRNAFSNCKSLETLDLPESLTFIDEYAFYGCSSLKSVSIPKGVTTVNAYAYGKCSDLESVTIPSTVTSIGNSAFSGCSSLKSIVLPYGVDTLDTSAFYNCTNLTDITIPSSVTTIGANVFAKCTSLTSITIPSSVTSIGNVAFLFCGNLKDVYIYSKEITLADDIFAPALGQTITVHGYDNIKTYVESLNNTSIVYKALDSAPVITSQPVNATAGVKSKASFKITAENAASYQWQYSKDGVKWYNSTATGAKTDTLTVTVSKTNSTNQYRCKVTGSDGSVIYSDTAEVDLIPGAIITSQPSSVCALIGEKTVFSVSAENASAYQWYYSKDNGTSWYKSTASGAATADLSITVSTTNKNNLYRCKITGPDGNTVTSSKAGAVVIAAQPQNSTASVGTTGTFTVQAASGTSIESYKWYYSKDSGANWYPSSSTGADTASLSLKVSSTNRTNLYRCKLTSAAGVAAYTKAVGFTDSSDAVKITKQPVSVSASTGDSISFTVKAENVAESGGYQWYYSKNGTTWFKSTAAGNNTETLKITVSDTNKSNQYRCKVTGKDGTVIYTNAVGVK